MMIKLILRILRYKTAHNLNNGSELQIISGTEFYRMIGETPRQAGGVFAKAEKEGII